MFFIFIPLVINTCKYFVYLVWCDALFSSKTGKEKKKNKSHQVAFVPSLGTPFATLLASLSIWYEANLPGLFSTLYPWDTLWQGRPVILSCAVPRLLPESQWIQPDVFRNELNSGDGEGEGMNNVSRKQQWHPGQDFTLLSSLRASWREQTGDIKLYSSTVEYWDTHSADYTQNKLCFIVVILSLQHHHCHHHEEVTLQ